MVAGYARARPRRGCVQAACDRGEIIRTHVLRPTWHFVAADDLRWMLRLTGPRVMAKTAGRLRDLGLDDATLARIYDVLSNTLADGEPRTRRELAAVLAADGIDPSGQRIAHAVGQAELERRAVQRPAPRLAAHVLPFDARVPPAPDRQREDDVAELALRFFRSHGPATLRDFAWWSGLTIADGRAGVAAAGDALQSVDDERGTRGSPRPATRRAAGASGRAAARHLRRDRRCVPRPAHR